MRTFPSPLRPRRYGARLATTLMAGCAFALAHAAMAETLADAVAEAYQTNPGLLSQRAQLRALNETYVSARSNYGPRVSADASLATDVTHYGPYGELDANSNSAQLQLSQPLFTGGRAAATVQAAEADVRSGRERLRQNESDLLQRVVDAYIAVRRDQQILTVIRETVSVLQNQLAETQARVDVRENTRTDLAQSQARLASAKAQEFAAEASLASSRAQYQNAVGHNPGDLAPEPDLDGVPLSIDAAFDLAEANNPTLRQVKYTELGSRARVAVAKAQNMPNIGLQLSASHSPQALYLPQPYINSLTAQATFSQPLFTAGSNGSDIRRAVENNNSDRLNIDATRRNVIQTLTQEWTLLSAARSALAADQANITASETAFYGMHQEERLGLRETIETLNAEQELTGAQLTLLRDRYNEYAARIAVLNLMGRLTVDALAPGVDPYDPTPDFDRVKNKGALPIEQVVRALDSIVTPELGPPMAAREALAPDQQSPLPPPPPSAAETPPLASVTTLMDAAAPPR